MPENEEEAPLDVLAMGELIVEMVAVKSGPLAESPTFTRSPGGATAAVAAGVARLGRRAAFAGVVGDDPFGRYLIRTLSSYGVDTGNIRADPRARTPVAFVPRVGDDGEVSADIIPPKRDDGEFLFYHEGGADGLLGPSAVPLDALGGASVFVCSGASLASPLPRAALQTAFEQARANGVLVAFDANWRPHLWNYPQRARDLYREVVADVDILKLNTAELIMLTRGAASTEIRRQESILQAWIERMVRGRKRPLLVALTRGPAGCSFALWKPGKGLEIGHLPAPEIDVKDRSGAGDAFLAALLVTLLDKHAPLSAPLRGRVVPIRRNGHSESAEQLTDGAAPVSGVADPAFPSDRRIDLSRLQRDELEQLFTWANTAGALASAHRGTMAGLPSRNTILRMIKGRGELRDA